MTGAPHPLRCEPRTEVRLFAEAMERTLRKHDHKGGWDEMSLGDILERIRGELKEVEKVWNAVKTREDYEQVSKELIDVANFCMMFYDNLHPELYHTLHNSATTSAEQVLLTGIDHISQKLQLEFDDGGYNPDIPLWGQVLQDLQRLKELRSQCGREPG